MSVERHVEFETSFNFRDIGGYETVEGTRVRTGSVFRADTLHRFTSADLELVSTLGLRTVIDLRSTEELSVDGRFARADDVAFHHLPLFEQDALPFVPAQRDTPAPPPGEDYVAIATSGAREIATCLTVIAGADYSVVFHCAAGKDRTGIVAAVLLSLLDVPDEIIAADYRLSERAIPLAIAWAESNDPVLEAEFEELAPWLLEAPEANMHAFLDQLRTRHGSIEGYVRDAGVTHDVMATLRERLLEPSPRS